LLAVQVTPNGNVLGNGVLLVEGIEEASTFQAVVALRPQLFIHSQLAAQDQNGTTIVLHRS
jgi:hypothetical protein